MPGILRLRPWLCACVVLQALTLAVPVYGDYFDPPDWDHGDPTFTHQEWEFYTDQRLFVPPDIDDNPYEGPHYANIIGGQPHRSEAGGAWLWYPGCGGTDMAFRIPNESDPFKVKLVWLEITVTVAPSRDLTVDDIEATCGAPSMPTVTLLWDKVLSSGGRYYYQALWELDPQPDEEWVTFIPKPNTGEQFAIEEVDIDTICIPEPATLSLLVLGGVALLRRRR